MSPQPFGSPGGADSLAGSRAESVRFSDPQARPGPSSRSRRRLLALVGGGGLLATAGCLSALGSSGASNASAGLTPDRLAFADGFDVEAASLAGTYGDHGVWGLVDGSGVDGPTYVGAYRDSLAVPDGDGNGSRDGDPWVTADAAAVVYRVDAYAPRESFREGPVPVSLGEGGPSGRTPLPGGGIAPDDGARIGPGGRFGVAWRGIARGTRSVNAVCEFRPADDGEGPFEVTATVGVAGGRGVL